MRAGELVFVDTRAWIALALTRDPLHPRASETWALLASAGARLHTSLSIVVETFTFLDRNSVAVPRDADVGVLDDHPLDDVATVLLDERVGLVIRKAAVDIEADYRKH